MHKATIVIPIFNLMAERHAHQVVLLVLLLQLLVELVIAVLVVRRAMDSRPAALPVRQLFHQALQVAHHRSERSVLWNQTAALAERLTEQPIRHR